MKRWKAKMDVWHLQFLLAHEPGLYDSPPRHWRPIPPCPRVEAGRLFIYAEVLWHEIDVGRRRGRRTTGWDRSLPPECRVGR